jgi:hypothetical protein
MGIEATCDYTRHQKPKFDGVRILIVRHEIPKQITSVTSDLILSLAHDLSFQSVASPLVQSSVDAAQARRRI